MKASSGNALKPQRGVLPVSRPSALRPLCDEETTLRLRNALLRPLYGDSSARETTLSWFSSGSTAGIEMSLKSSADQEKKAIYCDVLCETRQAASHYGSTPPPKVLHPSLD
ncbi:hypothetical protein EYF80_067350 [Liparis tanakae]|uniref:Uncharacterized protein n=1 Tax=Liparis tanakae TaxID=230148 RepID=A0A4Z2E126_9TELE|nr:hypothetical protein EYF80_067350 [Liparis tanakae]